MTTIRYALLAAGALTVAAAQATAQATFATSLEQSFRTPPNSAQPRVWWHWMNANVTRRGIDEDLAWMHRIGVGGLQNFDASLNTPRIVQQPVTFMSDAWKSEFHHAVTLADSLGLEFTIASSPGWSETGGPWVKPEQAMKKFVWSETRVSGPRKFAAKLAAPPSNNGPFLGMRNAPDLNFPPERNLPGAKPMAAEPPAAPDPTYYADAKVIAYRLPESDVRMADAHPRVTTPAGDVDAAALMDGDVSKTIPFALPEGAPETWMQLEFATPYRAEALTLAGAPQIQFVGGLPIPEGRLESSQDGQRWTTLVTLPGAEPTSAVFAARTYAFAPTTARFYRVVMKRPRANPFGASFGMPPQKAIDLSELELVGAPRVNRWQEKALYGLLSDYGPALATPATNAAVRISDVVDLTSRMRADGTLDWNVPAGRWAVLRLGYSLEGTKNHPASPEATGYEVDKLNRAHVGSYINHYTDQIRSALGPQYGKGFRFLLLDSYEAGMENWTDDMIAQFRARRGYDPTRYLPVLTGRVVGSAAESDKFLWDFRRTVADLFADNHYGTIADTLRKQGLGLYAEAMGADFPTSGEGLQDKGRATIPMAEFWTPGPGQDDGPNHMADMKEAASTGHIYGKPIVAAESFTTMPPPLVPAFSQSPFYLKRLADRALAHGINRFVIHTSVHQPFVDDEHKPGMTLGFFGQHYSRNNTWAEQSVAWNTYLARASHLLQQGRFVADLAYFYGEGAPNAVPYWKPVDPAFPVGYDYDWMNAEVLSKAEVRGGRLVLPSGMSYRALVLPADVTQLTLPMARKLRALVAAGATVIAPPPTGSPSLSDGAAGDDSVRAIGRAVWGAVDGKAVTEHAYGSGKVYWGRSVDQVLPATRVLPDLTFGSDSAATLAWIHRQAGDVDIYFVANQRDRARDVTASFRASGREPELWDAATGETQPASYTSRDGRTDVPLHLDPYGSTFVVFRQPTSVASREPEMRTRVELATVSGPWDVRFQPNRGAPADARFDSLTSWTTSVEAGVKYFSGTATYAKEITVPEAALKPGAQIEIDLGAVREIAELSVNGTPVGGILWKPPYRAVVTRALHAGANRVEVRVTNLWPNRMIGDLQPGVTKTYTFTDFRPFTKDSRLLESGLLGPVRLERVELVQRAQSLKGSR